MKYIKVGDKVKWKDLKGGVWISEVIAERISTLSINHLDPERPRQIILRRKRILEHYTKTENPEEYL